MPPAVVVVLPLVGNDDSGLGQRSKHVDVQAFVSNSGVEGLDVAVAPRLTGWDEGQGDPFAGPVGHCRAGQFGALVAAQHSRIAARSGEPVELGD